MAALNRLRSDHRQQCLTVRHQLLALGIHCKQIAAGEHLRFAAFDRPRGGDEL
jgi:hypothetical protein